MKRSKRKRQVVVHGVPQPLRLPKALFTTGFDSIANDWHKSPSADAALLPSIRRRLALEGVRVSEALLLAPKVSFRVYGENDVLCRLLDTFGVAGVERLLEEGALEFVLWRGDVACWNAEPRPQGLLPLCPLNLTTAAHCEPDASNELGLKRDTRPWAEVKHLSRLATARTVVLDEKLPTTAIDAVYSAYRSGALVTSGFDSRTPLERLGHAHSERLSQLAGDVLEGMLLLAEDYDLHESFKSWQAFVDVASKIPKDDRVITTMQQALRLEGLPDLMGMMKSGAVTFSDIVEMRGHSATQEFRKWLWGQPDPRDVKRVSEEYARKITQRKAVDRTWFKVAKILGVNAVQTVVGAGIGAGIAGVPGMIVGGVAGAAMSAGETFALDKVLRGVSPRRFAEEVIRPRMVQKSIGPVAAGENRAQRRASAAKQRKT